MTDNIKILVDYIDGLDDKSSEELMEVLYKVDWVLYDKIIGYKLIRLDMEELDNVDLEEDYDVIKEMGKK